MGNRPFKINIIDDKIYAACDRSDGIAVIDCAGGEVKMIDAPNNGNMDIDESNHRIFISNTSEIIVYDMLKSKIIRKIAGLCAISYLILNKEKDRLYVVDKLLRDFRIYDAVNFKLMYRFEDLAANPEYLLLDEDDKTVYISFENTGIDPNRYDILKVDIIHKNSMKLILQKGSSIAGMFIKDSTLYAANRVLNRIELIDTESFKAYGSISTSLCEPTRILGTSEGTKLLVTNRNSNGMGGIDIIDIKNRHIIGRVLMDTYNSQPYDIVSAIYREPCEDDVSSDVADLLSMEDIKEQTTIIAKRVFACLHKKINFPEAVIKLPIKDDLRYSLEEIKFNNGFIVKGSEVRTPINGGDDLFRVEFLMRITYVIYYRDEMNKRYSCDGFLENIQDVTIHIPKGRNEDEVQIILKTISKAENDSDIYKDICRFKAVTLMEVRMVGDDMITVPGSYNYFPKQDIIGDTADREEYMPFQGCNIPLFPKEMIFKYLHNS